MIKIFAIKLFDIDGGKTQNEFFWLSKHFGDKMALFYALQI